MLDRAPIAKLGDRLLGDWIGETVRCMRCGQEHDVENGSRDEEVGNAMQFVRCGKTTFLVGVRGRAIK